MKRLLCILSAMNAGGAETFMMKLYRQIDKTEYKIDFCVNESNRCFYDDEIESYGGKIYHIVTKSENFKEYKRQLYSVVKDNGYSYVMRITSNGFGFLDLKIAKKAGAKKCIARSSNSSDGGSLKSKIFNIVGRILFDKYVDVRIAPSDLAAKYTFGKRAYNSGKVTVLHNALDLNEYKYDRVAGEEIRKNHVLSSNALVIGHIGRFTAQKNHTFLLDVFSEVKKRDNSAVLMLVGKGEKEEKIKAKIQELGLEDSVKFLGIRSDIAEILSAMDVFVFPSLYEGMPNTVIEAQATGLPCVISDTITSEANITGLVEYCSLSSSIKEWADKVIKAVARDRKSTEALFVEKQYDIASVAEKFIELIWGEARQ